MNSGLLADALSVFRTLDPVAWLSLSTRLPWPVAAGAVLLGGFLLAVGGGKAFRVIAAPVGALLGLLWGGALAGPVGLAGSETALALGSALLLFGIGALAPSAVVAIAFGAPVGLAFGGLVGNTGFLLGFVPAALLAGAVAAVLHRPLRVLVAASTGAALLLLGLLRLLQGVPAVAELARAHAGWLLAAAGVVAFAAAVVQLAASMHGGAAKRSGGGVVPPGALQRGTGG
jgi:hypothetical protein